MNEGALQKNVAAFSAQLSATTFILKFKLQLYYTYQIFPIPAPAITPDFTALAASSE